MLYENIFRYEEIKSIILINKLSEAISGKNKKVVGDKPDIEKFEKLYGSKIKRPNKENKS